MIKATTPTITLTLPDNIDLTSADAIYVTFSQFDVTLTKTLGEDVELISPYVIAVTLTQEESLMFVATNYPVNVQVNWMVNGTRIATEIGQLILSPNLIPEVIES